MTLWLQAPIFQKRLEFSRDFLVAWDVRVLIVRENIGERYPARCVDQEDVFVALSMPQIDNLLVLSLEVLPESSVGIWPAPRSENEYWLMPVNCSQASDKVVVDLDELGVRDVLGRVVRSNVDDYVRCSRLVPRKVPGRREIVVRCVKVPRILSPEKLKRHSVLIPKRNNVRQRCTRLCDNNMLGFERFAYEERPRLIDALGQELTRRQGVPDELESKFGRGVRE